MKKIKNFFSNRKGMYRIAFTICILFLSGLVVTMTENKKITETPVAVETKMIEPMVVAEFENTTAETKESPSVVEVGEPSVGEGKFEDVTISPPIYGRVQKSFSIDEPIYSKTMDDWRIHPGIDITCDYGAEIYAAQDGVIVDIGYDLNFGNYITVENGEYELRYTSLSSDIRFEVGDEISKGQLLSTVTDSCISEICDEPHFHFEIKKNDEFVNPEEYVIFE